MELAHSAADSVARRGREEADRIKQQAADKAEDIADALDAGTEELEGNGGDALSGYAHSMASLMRRMAGGLRENDIEDFASELSDYARRNPAMFLAGSVALGFGISRFLKASSSRTHELDQRYELDYDDDYDVEGYDEEYEFDTTLEPATKRTAEDGLQPSARPGVTRRASEESWPQAPGDPAPRGSGTAPIGSGTAPIGSTLGGSSSSSSRPSDGRIEGGNDRG
jgi:hypothetical protein